MAGDEWAFDACDPSAIAVNSVADRRQFLKTVVASGAVWAADYLVVCQAGIVTDGERRRIVVDYHQCAGCRTCETVCAQANDAVSVAGQSLWGLGNPRRASIHVYHFSQDIDIPVVCVRCEDAPCTLSCPVPPDGAGHRAIYRDAATGSIISDSSRCIGCRQCAQACREQRVGAIADDPKTGQPGRLCSLCGGDPQCVRYCPYGALSLDFPPSEQDRQLVPVAKIADALDREWYAMSDQ